MAGAFGAVMQIVFKGTGELVGAGAWDSPALWASAVAILPLATTQMAYLNTGMQVSTQNAIPTTIRLNQLDLPGLFP